MSLSIEREKTPWPVGLFVPVAYLSVTVALLIIGLLPVDLDFSQNKCLNLIKLWMSSGSRFLYISAEYMLYKFLISTTTLVEENSALTQRHNQVGYGATFNDSGSTECGLSQSDS